MRELEWESPSKCNQSLVTYHDEIPPPNENGSLMNHKVKDIWSPSQHHGWHTLKQTRLSPPIEHCVGEKQGRGKGKARQEGISFIISFFLIILIYHTKMILIGIFRKIYYVDQCLVFPYRNNKWEGHSQHKWEGLYYLCKKNTPRSCVEISQNNQKQCFEKFPNPVVRLVSQIILSEICKGT